jgi:hypothetical protein
VMPGEVHLGIESQVFMPIRQSKVHQLRYSAWILT